MLHGPIDIAAETGQVETTENHMSDNACQLNRSMQHHPVHRFDYACAGEPSVWLYSVDT